MIHRIWCFFLFWTVDSFLHHPIPDSGLLVADVILDCTSKGIVGYDKKHNFPVTLQSFEAHEVFKGQELIFGNQITILAKGGPNNEREKSTTVIQGIKIFDTAGKRYLLFLAYKGGTLQLLSLQQGFFEIENLNGELIAINEATRTTQHNNKRYIRNFRAFTAWIKAALVGKGSSIDYFHEVSSIEGNSKHTPNKRWTFYIPSFMMYR
jgi:hypothetical protein